MIKFVSGLVAAGFGIGMAFFLSDRVPDTVVYALYGAAIAMIVNIPIFVIALRLLLRAQASTDDVRREVRQAPSVPMGYGQQAPVIVIDPSKMAGQQQQQGGIIQQGMFKPMNGNLNGMDGIDAWG